MKIKLYLALASIPNLVTKWTLC